MKNTGKPKKAVNRTINATYGEGENRTRTTVGHCPLKAAYILLFQYVATIRHIFGRTYYFSHHQWVVCENFIHVDLSAQNHCVSHILNIKIILASATICFTNIMPVKHIVA